MALIMCPECKNKISSKAELCINCGCPMDTINVMRKIQRQKRQCSDFEQFNALLGRIESSPLKENFTFPELEEKIIELLEYCSKNEKNIESLLSLNNEYFIVNNYKNEKNVSVTMQACFIMTVLNKILKNKEYITYKEYKETETLYKIKPCYLKNSYLNKLGIYIYKKTDRQYESYVIFNNKENYDKYVLKNKYNNELYLSLSESILSLVVDNIVSYIENKNISMEQDLGYQVVVLDLYKQDFYEKIKDKIQKIYERNVLNLKDLSSFNLVFIEDDKPKKLGIFITYDCFFAMLNLEFDYSFKKITIENKDRYYYLTKKDEVNVIYDCIKCNNNEYKIRVKMSEQSELFKQMYKKSFNAKEFINESVSLIEIEELNEKINTIIKRINKIRVEISDLNDIIHERRYAIFRKKVKEREEAENKINELKIKLEEEKLDIYKLINKVISKIKEDTD